MRCDPTKRLTPPVPTGPRDADQNPTPTVVSKEAGSLPCQLGWTWGFSYLVKH
jgi:hypothetical protein